MRRKCKFFIKLKVKPSKYSINGLLAKRNSIVNEKKLNLFPKMIVEKRNCSWCPVNKACAMLNIT